MAERNSRLDSLHSTSPSLFLVAGGLLTVFAALLGYEALMNAAAPEDIFGPPGFFFAMLGVLGLYPTLANPAPRLARASAIAAAIAAVGWFVITVLSIAEAAGVLPALEAMGPLGFIIIPITGVMMILAYLLVSVISLRTRAHTWILGLFLVLPPVIFGVMLTQAVLHAQFGLFTATTMTWSAVALSGGQAIVHLAIGYVLKTRTLPANRVEPPADATP